MSSSSEIFSKYYPLFRLRYSYLSCFYVFPRLVEIRFTSFNQDVIHDPDHHFSCALPRDDFIKWLHTQPAVVFVTHGSQHSAFFFCLMYMGYHFYSFL